MATIPHAAAPPLSETDVLREESCVLEQEARRAGAPLGSFSALCLSGGGIRSASYCIGIIEGLARHDLLHCWEYLSTVSGGGFAGGWLAAWSARRGGDIHAVIDEFRRSPDPEPIKFVRAKSAYLQVVPGLSAGSPWAFAGLYLQKIFLNWLVVLPLLLFLTMLPQFVIHDPALITPPPWLTTKHPAWFERVLSPDAAAAFVQGSVKILNIASLTFILGLASSYLVIRPALPRMLQGHLGLWGFAVLLLAGALGMTETWAWLTHAGGSVGFSSGEILSFIAFGIVSYAWTALAWPHTGASAPRRALASLAAGVLQGLALFLASRLLPVPAAAREVYACVVPAAFLLLRAVVDTVFLRVALGRLATGELSWWTTARAWLVLVSTGLGVVSMVVVFGPLLVHRLSVIGQVLLALGGVMSCLVFAALGYAATAVATREKRALRNFKRGVWLAVFAALATLFIIVGHAVVVSWLLGWLFPALENLRQMLFARYMSEATIAALKPVLLGAIVLLPAIIGFFVDANNLTLHTMYRSSLVNAFLAASRQDRRPDPLTEQDPNDDIPIAELPRRPFIIVNTAVALRPDLSTFSRRETASFGISPLHVGCAAMGFRPTVEYAGGLSLGTAMAISGAAISSNVRSEVPAYIKLVAAVLNVGLGRWVGNPGWRHWRAPKPIHAAAILSPMLAGVIDKSWYVHVSDGGHFDNLGVYEMVRRRCSPIVVIDATCDPDYTCDDLANVIQKIRTDFNVSLQLEESPVGKDGWHRRGVRCLRATVRYSDADPGAPDGDLFYVKPVVCGNEPIDVQNYAIVNPDFPHQSTTDQWFDEAQFESYRILGRTTIDEIHGILRGPLQDKSIAAGTDGVTC